MLEQRIYNLSEMNDNMKFTLVIFVVMLVTKIHIGVSNTTDKGKRCKCNSDMHFSSKGCKCDSKKEYSFSQKLTELMSPTVSWRGHLKPTLLAFISKGSRDSNTSGSLYTLHRYETKTTEKRFSKFLEEVNNNIFKIKNTKYWYGKSDSSVSIGRNLIQRILSRGMHSVSKRSVSQAVDRTSKAPVTLVDIFSNTQSALNDQLPMSVTPSQKHSKFVSGPNENASFTNLVVSNSVDDKTVESNLTKMQFDGSFTFPAEFKVDFGAGSLFSDSETNQKSLADAHLTSTEFVNQGLHTSTNYPFTNTATVLSRSSPFRNSFSESQQTVYGSTSETPKTLMSTNDALFTFFREIDVDHHLGNLFPSQEEDNKRGVKTTESTTSSEAKHSSIIQEAIFRNQTSRIHKTSSALFYTTQIIGNSLATEGRSVDQQMTLNVDHQNKFHFDRGNDEGTTGTSTQTFNGVQIGGLSSITPNENIPTYSSSVLDEFKEKLTLPWNDIINEGKRGSSTSGPVLNKPEPDISNSRNPSKLIILPGQERHDDVDRVNTRQKGHSDTTTSEMTSTKTVVTQKQSDVSKMTTTDKFSLFDKDVSNWLKNMAPLKPEAGISESNNVTKTTVNKTTRNNMFIRNTIRVKTEAAAITDVVLQVLCGCLSGVVLSFGIVLFCKYKRLNLFHCVNIPGPAVQDDSVSDHRSDAEMAASRNGEKNDLSKHKYRNKNSWNDQPECTISFENEKNINYNLYKEKRINTWPQSFDKFVNSKAKDTESGCNVLESRLERENSCTVDSPLNSDSKDTESLNNRCVSGQCAGSRSSIQVSKTYALSMSVENKTHVTINQSMSSLTQSSANFNEKQIYKPSETISYTEPSHAEAFQKTISKKFEKNKPSQSITSENMYSLPFSEGENGNNLSETDKETSVLNPREEFKIIHENLYLLTTAEKENTEAEDINKNQNNACDKHLQQKLVNSDFHIQNQINVRPKQEENENIRNDKNIQEKEILVAKFNFDEILSMSQEVSACKKKDEDNIEYDDENIKHNFVRKSFEMLSDEGHLTDTADITNNSDTVAENMDYITETEVYNPVKEHDPDDNVSTSLKKDASSKDSSYEKAVKNKNIDHEDDTETVHNTENFRTVVCVNTIAIQKQPKKSSKSVLSELVKSSKISSRLNTMSLNKVKQGSIWVTCDEGLGSIRGLKDRTRQELNVFSKSDERSTVKKSKKNIKTSHFRQESVSTLYKTEQTANEIHKYTTQEIKPNNLASNDIVVVKEDSRKQTQQTNKGNLVLDMKSDNVNIPEIQTNIPHNSTETEMTVDRVKDDSKGDITGKEFTRSGSSYKDSPNITSECHNTNGLKQETTSSYDYLEFLKMTNTGETDQRHCVTSEKKDSDGIQEETCDNLEGKEIDNELSMTICKGNKLAVMKKSSDSALNASTSSNTTETIFQRNISNELRRLSKKSHSSALSKNPRSQEKSISKQTSDFTFCGTKFFSVEGQKQPRSKTETELISRNRARDKRNKRKTNLCDQQNIKFRKSASFLLDTEKFIKEPTCMDAYSHVLRDRTQVFRSTQCKLDREACLYPKYNVIHPETIYSPFERICAKIRKQDEKKQMTKKTKKPEMSNKLCRSSTFIISDSHKKDLKQKTKRDRLMREENAVIATSQMNELVSPLPSDDQTKVRTRYGEVPIQKAKPQRISFSDSEQTKSKQKVMTTRESLPLKIYNVKMKIPEVKPSSNIPRLARQNKIKKLSLPSRNTNARKQTPGRFDLGMSVTRIVRETTFNVDHDLQLKGIKDATNVIPVANESTHQLPILLRDKTFCVDNPTNKISVSLVDLQALLPNVNK